MDLPLHSEGEVVVSEVGASNPRLFQQSPLLYQRLPKRFPKWLYHVIVPPVIFKFVSSPTVGTVSIFHFSYFYGCVLGFPGGTSGKEPAYQCRSRKRFGFDPWVGKILFLEEGMTTHSSILAWRTPWTEEPGRLQSIGSQSWT